MHRIDNVIELPRAMSLDPFAQEPPPEPVKPVPEPKNPAPRKPPQKEASTEAPTPRNCGTCEFWKHGRSQDKHGVCLEVARKGLCKIAIRPDAEFGCKIWRKKT